jgi:hypothetical protein
MKKKFILIGILCFVCSWVGLSSEKPIWPTANFTANFCNFPQAWSLNRGEKVNIGIIFNETDKTPNWIKITASLAPGAEVNKTDLGKFLNLSPEITRFQVLLVLKEMERDQFAQALKAVEFFTRKGVAIILPAYFGPMKADYDYQEWRTFIKDASQAGVVIVGAHGRFYQLGNLSFWKQVPVDIFSLHTGIDDWEYLKPEAMIRNNLESGVYKAAAAAALLKSREPHLTPKNLKQIFRDKGRYVAWGYIRDNKGWVGAFPFLSKKSIQRYLKKNEKYQPKLEETFEGCTLDAALLLGLPPMEDGEWSRKILNVTAAQRLATGKGVTVAILDHLFDKENPALKNRIIKPGSVLEGEPVFTVDGHGTWMAEDLVKVAPDIKIMPVRMCCKNDADYTSLYIKGIEYAVENGADIISLSHRAVPKEKQDALDKAIEKASQKGVTFVFIHYYGPRKDVVRPGPIEFASSEKQEYIYVVGTNFINESAFPATWGVSQTAPIVSGVIAMMKELNPALKPMEIKQILLKSYNLNPEGYPLLDAFKAVRASGGQGAHGMDSSGPIKPFGPPGGFFK